MELHPDIDLGGFPIYVTMAFVGAVAAILIALFNINRFEGKDQVKKYLFIPFMAVAFIIGFFCANIGNWFVIPGKLLLPLMERIQTSGFAFYFGIIGFFISVIIILAVARMDIPSYLNLMVPSVLLFHAFGRIGCSLAGCCFGVPLRPPVDLGIFTLFYFPAREIEALSLFAMFFITQYGIKKRRMLFYAIAYPVVRFLLEFGRGDLRGRMFTDIFSPAQEISIIILFGVLVYGVIKLIVHIKKKSRPADPSVPA